MIHARGARDLDRQGAVRVGRVLAADHVDDEGLVDGRAHGDVVVAGPEEEVLQAGLADGGPGNGEGEGEVALYCMSRRNGLLDEFFFL